MLTAKAGSGGYKSMVLTSVVWEHGRDVGAMLWVSTCSWRQTGIEWLSKYGMSQKLKYLPKKK